MIRGRQIWSALISIGLVGELNVTAYAESPYSDTKIENDAHMIMINGTVEPEKIPYGVKYRMLFKMYELRIRDQLSGQLSAEDDRIIMGMVAADEEEEKINSATYEQALVQLCSNRSNKNAVDMAHEMDKIVAEWNARNETRYRKGIGSLSERGQQIIANYVETEIVPHTKSASRGMVQLAIADPEDFLTGLETQCYAINNGELPPDVQEVIDDYAHKKGITFQSQ